MSQVGDYASKFLQPLFYFCRVREVCANAPPNPRHATGKSQLIFQLGNHIQASSIRRVSVTRFKCSQRLSPGSLSTQTVFDPEG